MNISEIKATPILKKAFFRDYPVPMEKVIEQRSIKNWIGSQHDWYRDVLRAKLFEQGGAFLRVRHNEDGAIREMEISQNFGALCCMCYSREETWPELISMIDIKAGDRIENDGDEEVVSRAVPM